MPALRLYKQQPVTPPDLLLYPCPPCRRTHPNDHGHQVLAELLAGLVLGAVDEQQRQQAGGEPGQNAGWAQRSAEVQQALAAIPPPMIPGNAEEPTSLCAIQVRLMLKRCNLQGWGCGSASLVS